jgi:hypothetical protein
MNGVAGTLASSTQVQQFGQLVCVLPLDHFISDSISGAVRLSKPGWGAPFSRELTQVGAFVA